MSVPFGERGGALRGGLDLVSGRFPRFVFGGGVGDLLPAFHFHDEAHDDLDGKLRYLAENEYRTVTADEIARFVRHGSPVPDRAVALCFDDAWTRVWTTAGPLLRQYGLRAIVYVIPGRTVDASACRPRGVDSPGGSPFMTWAELLAMRDEGTIDIQSHTFSHAMVPTSTAPLGFVTPGYERSSLLGRPLVPRADAADSEGEAFETPDDLGAPLFEQRSRMSDGTRARQSVAAREACLELARAEGGAAFFLVPSWRGRLEAELSKHASEAHVETESDVQAAVERELDRARATLNARLGGQAIRHVCLPWGVSGRHTAAALARLGFETAVANRMPGVHAIRRGDSPYWLKRLPNKFIYRLPGRGRRWWFTAPS